MDFDEKEIFETFENEFNRTQKNKRPGNRFPLWLIPIFLVIGAIVYFAVRSGQITQQQPGNITNVESTPVQTSQTETVISSSETALPMTEETPPSIQDPVNGLETIIPNETTIEAEAGSEAKPTVTIEPTSEAWTETPQTRPSFMERFTGLFARNNANGTNTPPTETPVATESEPFGSIGVTPDTTVDTPIADVTAIRNETAEVTTTDAPIDDDTTAAQNGTDDKPSFFDRFLSLFNRPTKRQDDATETVTAITTTPDQAAITQPVDENIIGTGNPSATELAQITESEFPTLAPTVPVRQEPFGQGSAPKLPVDTTPVDSIATVPTRNANVQTLQNVTQAIIPATITATNTVSVAGTSVNATVMVVRVQTQTPSSPSLTITDTNEESDSIFTNTPTASIDAKQFPNEPIDEPFGMNRTTGSDTEPIEPIEPMITEPVPPSNTPIPSETPLPTATPEEKGFFERIRDFFSGNNDRPTETPLPTTPVQPGDNTDITLVEPTITATPEKQGIFVSIVNFFSGNNDRPTETPLPTTPIQQGDNTDVTPVEPTITATPEKQGFFAPIVNFFFPATETPLPTETAISTATLLPTATIELNIETATAYVPRQDSENPLTGKQVPTVHNDLNDEPLKFPEGPREPFYLVTSEAPNAPTLEPEQPGTQLNQPIVNNPLTQQNQPIVNNPLTQQNQPIVNNPLTQQNQPIVNIPLTQQNQPIVNNPLTQQNQPIVHNPLTQPVETLPTELPHTGVGDNAELLNYIIALLIPLAIIFIARSLRKRGTKR